MKSLALVAFVVVAAGCHDFDALSSHYGDADLGADMAISSTFSSDLAQSGAGDLPLPQDLASSDLAGDAAMPIVGHLTGSGVATNSIVDLTSVGTSDWAHWGFPSAAIDRKAGPLAQIGNFTPIGGTAAAYSNNPVGYSWSDGAVTPSVTSTTTGVFIAGMGAGFQLTVPASTASRTLLVYVGGYRSNGKLTATLSDQSAPDYSDSSFQDLVDNIYDATYTITYNAAKADQTLTITWTAIKVVMDGNVSLQSVALE